MRWFTILVLAAGLFAVPAELAGRQSPDELLRRLEQQLGRPITEQEILQQLRASGLTIDEVRRRLVERGYDPAAADPFFGVLEGRAARVPAGTDPVPILDILWGAERATGPAIPTPGVTPSTVLSAQVADTVPAEPGPPIFGRDLFRRATTEFMPLASGPVPPDYRIGPGDELILVITGDVELAYELTVSPEGWVVIPGVGQVFVADRTVDGIRGVLFDRLSQVYSGIREGADATTFFHVSLGRLRTNQVFVIGEVERPAAYELSAMATGLTALYYAGGPSRAGSFRRVHINRGGSTVRTLDLYDYLVRGIASGDDRLEHGDIVFVPVAERRVEIDGAVVRPGLYEMLPDEDLRDLLRFAGGVQPNAELRSVQIERILPLEARAPGRDRVVLDVPLGSLDGEELEPVPLRDGDRIRVFAVLDEVQNEVVVTGGVWRPGRYAVDENTRLWDIIERAGGLLPDAVEVRAQVQRLQPDWTRRLIPVSLARTASGEPVENPLLQGHDEIYIHAARELRDDRTVSIGGWVRNPGEYPYLDGMTVADLVLLAGGLRTGAYLAAAEVSRVVISQERSEALTQVFNVALDSALIFDRIDFGSGAPDLEGLEAADFELQNLDAVYIRKAPGFDAQAMVQVTGEVHFPGPYSIATRTERIRDLVLRAGGPTDEAYLRGVQLWRVRDEADPSLRVIDTLPFGDTLRADSSARATRSLERVRVGIAFEEALRNPASSHNILVQPGDSIYIPPFIPTVEVRGAVASPTKVLHRPDAGFDYYIRQAGGFLENADRERVRVQFANGETAIRGRKFLFLGGGMPDPDPGSVITVPYEPERTGDGVRVSDIVTIATSILTAAASLIVAVGR
ncbi:MAG TPA: SLBB domain-containing protein [Longimicrobiales bacterium]|nr:SLBB domain-containing protein [Longimicrobiales bacterium]